MRVMLLCVGAVALSGPALAQVDPSNPGNTPLSPSLGVTSQPQQAEVAPNALPPSARDGQENAAPLTRDQAESAESAAIDEAIRESEAARREPRKARIGAVTVDRPGTPPALASRGAGRPGGAGSR